MWYVINDNDEFLAIADDGYYWASDVKHAIKVNSIMGANQLMAKSKLKQSMYIREYRSDNQ